MSKLGGSSYPGDLRPEEAISWVEILLDRFDGATKNKKAFAKEVGHQSTSSGTFRRKLADARKYGLMTPRGDYEITELGKRLAQPKDERDRHDAIFRMLQDVNLLRRIGHELDSSEPPEEFWQVLVEVTDAEPAEAKKVEDWIKNLYETMIEALAVAEGQLPVDESDIPSNSEGRTQTAQKDARTQLTDEPDSALYVKVGNDVLRFEELTDRKIEIAQDFLEEKKGGGDGTYQMRL